MTKYRRLEHRDAGNKESKGSRNAHYKNRTQNIMN